MISLLFRPFRLKYIGGEKMKLLVNSVEQTFDIGKQIGEKVSPGDIICLEGDLGTGKTHLTKGIASGLSIDEHITSPTFNIVKSHAYYTNLILSPISGFDDVRMWASNHHEKLNGTGYPNKLTDKDLSLESRILAVCDIYQALTEDRPYRDGLSQKKSFDILEKMASDNLICIKAVKLLYEALNR